MNFIKTIGNSGSVLLTFISTYSTLLTHIGPQSGFGAFYPIESSDSGLSYLNSGWTI